MKYIFVAVTALVLLGGCSSANKKADSAATATAAAPQIVDEEFDLLVAPEYDYESDVAYEDQLKNDNAAPSAVAGAKPAKKPVAIKQ